MILQCLTLAAGLLCPTTETVMDEIEKQAQMYSVSPKIALRVANCESSYIYAAQNKNTSAGGIYQFIDSTWDWVGGDEKYNYIENIYRFMKLYKTNPEYWECK